MMILGSFSIEELLEGFWGYMIGNMLAVFFVPDFIYQYSRLDKQN